MNLVRRGLSRLIPASSLQKSFPINIRQFHTTPRAAVEMTTVRTTERLARLRELMKKNDVDVYSEGEK